MFSLALFSALLAVPGAFAAPTYRPPSNPTNASNPTNSSTHSKVAASWFTGWHTSAANAVPFFDTSNVTWANYTHMTYSFAVTTSSPANLSLQPYEVNTTLPNFVTAAHNNSVKALLSIGGWTGSIFFSDNVGSAENRTMFVKAATDLVTQFNLDGLEFDWEYPGSPNGLSCNLVNSNDTANYLAFFQELRNTTVGKNMILTATAVSPWLDDNGVPSANVSAFADVLDWVSIMDYDIWGPGYTPSVGPNSPLYDSCAAPANQQGSALEFVQQWTTAGLPANQIVLGVASYGHGYEVEPADAFTAGGKTLAAYPKYNENTNVTGDAWDLGPLVPDPCGNPGQRSGVFDFWGLVDGGFLDKQGSPNSGIAYRFDNCSQTAYVYNNQSKIMVSYDDVPSMTAKGRFITQQHLRGFAFWETGGDYVDLLLNAARDGMGI